MKTRLWVAFASCAIAAPTFAQNSVTLYGVLDEGLNYTTNVGGTVRSRWPADFRTVADGA